jgi:hypothetical protein
MSGVHSPRVIYGGPLSPLMVHSSKSASDGGHLWHRSRTGSRSLLIRASAPALSGARVKCGRLQPETLPISKCATISTMPAALTSEGWSL